MWQISSPLRHLILYLCRAVHLPFGNLMSSQKFRQIRFPRSKVCHMQNLGDRCNENMGRSTAMMVADSESQNFQYKNCAKSYDESEHAKKTSMPLRNKQYNLYVGKVNTSVGKALGGQNLNKNTKTLT